MAADDPLTVPAPPALTTEDLIAFGRYWTEVLREPHPRGTRDLGVTMEFLEAFVPAATAALAAWRKPRKTSRIGRPRGGMGEQLARFVANGISEDNAVAIIAKAFGKPETAVQRAHQRMLLQKTPAPRKRTRKKPPPSAAPRAKNPRR
jgi:hypothetical protein